MPENNPLARVVYISLPDSATRDIGGFKLRPDVRIPVELPDGLSEWKPEALSWESIVAGMLKVLGYDRSNPNAEYYRDFVRAVRPDIYREFTETGIITAKNHDFDLALEIFTVLDGLYPNDGLILLNSALVHEAQAAAHAEAGKEKEADEATDRAYEAYKRALSCTPPEPSAFFNAGYFYLKLNNFEKAKEAFTKFVDIGTDEGKVAKAKKALEQIESQNLLDTLFKEAYDFIKLGQEAEGIERITEFIGKNPDVWNAWFILGWAHRRLGHWEAGRDAFRKAIDLGADEVDTFNELAICLMELGNLDESRRMLERALKQEPENVKIISNLGILALKQGKKDEARGFFETVLEIEPEDTVSKNYLKEL